MNLKEAFRFSNRLTQFANIALNVLSREENITKTENTHLRSKVMPEATDETVVEESRSEYADRITEMVAFAVELLEQREKLAAAIARAKKNMELDFDSAAAINKARFALAGVLRSMADLRSSETVIHNGGTGYRFNVEGNQVSYRCDLKRVTTINFDRNAVRKQMAALTGEADAVSSELDLALITTTVDYEQPFDVNDSFTEAFAAFCEQRAA